MRVFRQMGRQMWRAFFRPQHGIKISVIFSSLTWLFGFLCTFPSFAACTQILKVSAPQLLPVILKCKNRVHWDLVHIFRYYSRSHKVHEYQNSSYDQFTKDICHMKINSMCFVLCQADLKFTFARNDKLKSFFISLEHKQTWWISKDLGILINTHWLSYYLQVLSLLLLWSILCFGKQKCPLNKMSKLFLHSLTWGLLYPLHSQQFC